MPFLKNAWYVAAWSGDVNAVKPLHRTLLDEPVVLYRDTHHRPVALADRCPHRFAPLHLGRLHGDTIECPYHGLRFNQSGACVHNPHGDGRIPTAARAQTFPVREQYGAIWIWMGESERAASTALPNFSFLDPHENETHTGYLLTRAHYQLSADNLLDLSHFQFLHPSTLGSDAMARSSTVTFSEDGETVWARRMVYSECLQNFVASAFSVPDGMLVDRWLNVRWDAPGLLSIEVGVTAAGTPPGTGRTSFSGHFLTPETETTTHYFFAFGLPKLMGSAARMLVEYAVDGLMTPFKHEDLPILEAQQRALGKRDFWSAQPVLLSIDDGAIRARRIMDRKIAAEQRERATVQVAATYRRSCSQIVSSIEIPIDRTALKR